MAFGVLISHALVKIQNCYLNETLKNVDRLCMHKQYNQSEVGPLSGFFFSATDSKYVF